ncbi:hypothetical protein HNY73_018709 [Argiope bruennichi]|uniref:Uncharacterized protein n=1 Tax=Argiope bruennichi TaxID=94029 RepID=A0A8T0EF63_ARGBR|nr:hypothetical protein HNY73_018709 [Argiope bruennichi]
MIQSEEGSDSSTLLCSIRCEVCGVVCTMQCEVCGVVCTMQCEVCGVVWEVPIPILLNIQGRLFKNGFKVIKIQGFEAFRC